VRVSDGYASNIFRCVRLKNRMITGLKSNDSHILMQQLLPIVYVDYCQVMLFNLLLRCLHSFGAYVQLC
jgi:hypothetical protein